MTVHDSVLISMEDTLTYVRDVAKSLLVLDSPFPTQQTWRCFPVNESFGEGAFFCASQDLSRRHLEMCVTACVSQCPVAVTKHLGQSNLREFGRCLSW